MIYALLFGVVVFYGAALFASMAALQSDAEDDAVTRAEQADAVARAAQAAATAQNAAAHGAIPRQRWPRASEGPFLAEGSRDFPVWGFRAANPAEPQADAARTWEEERSDDRNAQY